MVLGVCDNILDSDQELYKKSETDVYLVAYGGSSIGYWSWLLD